MAGPQPWMPGDNPTPDARRHAPATLRNRDHILPILREELQAQGRVLEIASGSGEHSVYFAQAMPDITWLPSDPDLSALASIAGYAVDARLPNLLQPVQIDASASGWPVDQIDAMLCINMIHISPWAATVGLFAGAARLLLTGAPLIAYGPFIEQGVPTAPSNAEFDANLRARDPAWGVRAVADVDVAAAQHGFARTRRVAMPANNLTLVWRKR